MKSLFKSTLVLIIALIMPHQDHPNIHLSCTIPNDQLELITKTKITHPITTKSRFENLIQSIHQNDFYHSALELVSLDSNNQPDQQDTILLKDGSCLRVKFNKDQLEYLVYLLPEGTIDWEQQELLSKILNPFIEENLNSNFDFYKLANGLEFFDEKQDTFNFMSSHDFHNFQSLFLMDKKARKLSIMIYK